MAIRRFKADPKSSVPLYAQLEQFLITGIRKGIYSPDELLPSITEIEGHANVGRVTIVRTMQELVKDGYAVGIHGKGYYVTQRGAKHLIGIVAPFNSVYMQIYVHLAAGVRNAADKLNSDVIIKSSEENPRTFIHAIEEFVNYQGSNWLVVVPPMNKDGNVSKESLDILQKMKRLKGVRYTVIDRNIPGDISQIRQNRFEGNMLLIKKALAKGCRKILFLNRIMNNPNFGGQELFDSLVRETGKVDSVVKLHYAVPVSVEEDMKRILDERYDSVFSDDLYARKIVNMAGASRPFHIAGYNGMAAATYIRPRITTVNSNLTEAGQIAVDYLFDKNTDSTIKVDINPFLIDGETL